LPFIDRWHIIPLVKSRLVKHLKVIEDDGGIIEIRMWQVLPSGDKPHGFKYSLVYIVDGVRIIGYDNAERQGDHKHFRDVTLSYEFKGLRQLTSDFYRDVERHKKGLL